ncbi:hypothetical protein N2152v2_004312 [Parachlorella kessleri]
MHSQAAALLQVPGAVLRQPCSSRRRRVLQPVRATAEVESAKQVLERAAAEATTNGAAAAAKPARFDGRAFRRSLNDTGRYTRKPSNDPSSLALMEEHGVGYSSAGLVAQMRENGNRWQQGEVLVELAEAYGFCWGVERAVQMAYEARRAYPQQRLHITNEIIHNPGVNQRLKEMDVQFIETRSDGEKDFGNVKQGDVVILPAFGASVQEMKLLNEREVQIVDTTCPWVSKVWTAVDNQARKGHTSVIHGKWAHEETIATASFAGTYIVVKDLAEAQYVCDYILHGGDKQAFLKKFANAVSQGFDPDVDLDNVGVANQTTMLKGETEAIGKLLEKTMMQKHGPAALSEHFMVMDTICDATQERQDAIYSMTGKQDTEEKLDMLLVVGGFNSSNTSHLQEIGEMKGIPSFWVDSAARIDVNANKIQHKASVACTAPLAALELAHGELVTTENWLRHGPLRIGVTSGASTPDKAVEDVLDRVFKIKDPSFKGVAPKKTAVKKAAHEEH